MTVNSGLADGKRARNCGAKVARGWNEPGGAARAMAPSCGAFKRRFQTIADRGASG
jgi:hypothetical protein